MPISRISDSASILDFLLGSSSEARARVDTSHLQVTLRQEKAVPLGIEPNGILTYSVLYGSPRQKS